MKLERLQLRRFKTFVREELSFAPITLLTGPNSSGKTSILQALCAIAQGPEGVDSFPFEFCLNGPLAALGDFGNVVNGHGSNGSFSVLLECNDGDDTLQAGGFYRKAEEGGAVATRAITLKDSRAGVEVAWNQKQHAYFLSYDSNVPLFTESLDLLTMSDVDPVLLTDLSQAMLPATSRARTTESVLQEAAKNTNLDVEKLANFWREQEQELRKGKIRLNADTLARAVAETRKLRPAASVIFRVRTRFARALRQVAYVGAVRAHPLRYYAAATAPAGFDPYGAGASLRLAQWKARDRSRFSSVKDALVQLELATDLKAETHLGEFVQVRITPTQRTYTDTLADVGFGVSQVLPMLVADAALPRSEGVVLINQPEVHLHPASQALLGNYFAERVNRRQYVIETHSEYLITRLRILVAKKQLRPEQVSIYFAMPTPDDNGSLMRKIDLDERGALIDAPKEFFRTYISDSYELALNSFPENVE